MISVARVRKKKDWDLIKRAPQNPAEKEQTAGQEEDELWERDWHFMLEFFKNIHELL